VARGGAGRDEDVGALDVAVQDLLRVEVDKALEDLADVAADDRLLEAPELGEHGREAAAGDKLQKDGERALLALRPKVLHDVRVPQVLHHHHLPLDLALGPPR